MTNPNPLIITNKFPSWIIQDKNQPPSSARPRHLTSSGWFISVFWRKHLFSYSGCQPSSPAPETVPESSPAQPRGHKHTSSLVRRKIKQRREWLVMWHCVSVSSVMCHLTCVISGGQSACHPDILVTSPRHWPSVTQPTPRPRPHH